MDLGELIFTGCKVRIWGVLKIYNSPQALLIKRMMEMFHIYTAQYGSHMWLLSTYMWLVRLGN